MRRRSSIVIRSEDHLGDPLGAIFVLDAEHTAGHPDRKAARRISAAQIQVLKAVVSRDKIEIEADCAAFPDESDRLVESARGLRRNRLYRSAESTLHEALKLDPLNPRADDRHGRGVLRRGEIFRGDRDAGSRARGLDSRRRNCSRCWVPVV